MRRIQKQMEKMRFSYEQADLMQEKDGILVARIHQGRNSYILKCFEKQEYRREVENYRILKSLGIPTLKVMEQTDSALLLEDLTKNNVYRLGEEADLKNPVVAEKIAGWYRQLHERGKQYVLEYGGGMYDEGDCFTRENIAQIGEKTGTQDAAIWKGIQDHFDEIRAELKKAERTMTYNDFYYTNLAVARDHSAAMMFDYNLLGKGYAYGDLRNVTSSLSESAARAFLKAYGGFDEKEKALDDVVSPVTALYMACARKVFPKWAQGVLQEMLEEGEGRVQRLLEKI